MKCCSSSIPKRTHKNDLKPLNSQVSSIAAAAAVAAAAMKHIY